MNEDQISEVFESFGFLKMSLKTMRLFLGSRMNCKEEELWDAVQDWAFPPANDHDTTDIESSDESIEDDAKSSSVPSEVTMDCQSTDLLKSIKDLIRFPTMDGVYFTENVLPLNVLTDKEVIDVFSYMHYRDGGCTAFSTRSRNAYEFS